MRKKLKDKDAELAESRAAIQQRVNELAIKERVIAERDGVVDELRQQITQLNAELQSSESTAGLTGDTEVRASIGSICICLLICNFLFFSNHSQNVYWYTYNILVIFYNQPDCMPVCFHTSKFAITVVC